METTKGPIGPVILSIIGGVLILGYGALILALGVGGLGSMANLTGTQGMTAGFVNLALEVLGAWGVICGLVMILSAVMVYRRPVSHVAWGLVIILFSILSIFGGAGLFIGLVIGIIGGAWAVMWKSPQDAPIIEPGTKI